MANKQNQKPQQLTEYQAAFCRAFVESGYCGSAAIEALGRKVACPRKTAYELRRHPLVKARIAQLISEQSQGMADLRARVITTLSNMLDAELPNCYDEKGKLLPMHLIPEAERVSLIQHDSKTWAQGDQQGSSSSIKLADKRQAAKDLARLLGMQMAPVDSLDQEREQMRDAGAVLATRLDGLRAKLMSKLDQAGRDGC